MLAKASVISFGFHRRLASILFLLLGMASAATDLKLSAVRALFEVDLFSVMAMNKEFINLLIAAEGRIVNVGSIGGLFPLPFGSAYCAAKAGLHAYGDVLRVELEPFKCVSFAFSLF